MSTTTTECGLCAHTAGKCAAGIPTIFVSHWVLCCREGFREEVFVLGRGTLDGFGGFPFGRLCCWGSMVLRKKGLVWSLKGSKGMGWAPETVGNVCNSCTFPGDSLGFWGGRWQYQSYSAKGFYLPQENFLFQGLQLLFLQKPVQ